MTAIDPRFLTLHPATEQWHGQRSKCQRCRHVEITDEAMRCTVARTVRTGGRSMAYCIDARAPGADSGPGAVLFSARAA